jgi:lipopolysaccharide export system protein LptA
MQGETIKRAGSRRLGPVDIAVSDRDRERAFQRARRHSVLVKLLKVVLPSIAAVSLGYYAMALMASSALKGSNIAVGKVTIDPSNLQMADPRYSGFGKDGSEYRVHAKSAVTDLRMSAPIKLNVIDGQITQPNGVVTSLKAKWGTYDQKKELLELYEKIDVDATNGMIARLTHATVFTKESRIVSNEPIYAETATGRIRAHSMTLDTKKRTAQFRDDVIVTLKPTQPVGTQNEGDAKKKRDAQAFGIDTSSNEPVVVTSRRLDVDDNARTALFRDNVIARQGEASLAAPELDVLYEGRANLGGKTPASDGAAGGSQASKLKSLHARGGVVMINKVDRAESQTLDYDALAERIALGGNVVMTQAPDRRVTAQTVVFEQKEDTALLTGEVVVNQGRNILRGDSLAIDRKAGTARLSSPPQGDEPAGRIFTLLYQSQTDKPGATKTKAKNRPEEEQPAALGALGANFKSDPNAPIDVEAQTLDVNDREHVAVYTGSVVAKQGTFVVKTEEMTAHYQGSMGLLGGAQPETAQLPRGAKGSGTGPGGSQLKRIEARRGVIVTGADGQKATGEWADFDVAKNTIVMGGNVMVSQGKQIVRAPAGMRLVIDLTTGVTRFEPEPGMAAKAGPKVSGAFSTSVSPAAPGMPGCPPGAVCKSGRLEAIFYPNQMKEKTEKGSGTKADRHHKATPQTGSAWTSTTRPSGTP